MTAWVLLIVLMSPYIGRGVAVTSVDMQTQDSCEAAAGMAKLLEKRAEVVVHTLCLKRA